MICTPKVRHFWRCISISGGFYFSSIALVYLLAQMCFLFDLPVMHLLPATRERVSLLPSPVGEGVTSFRVTDEELYNLVL